MIDRWHATDPADPAAKKWNFEQRIFAPEVHRQSHGPLAQHGRHEIPIAGVGVHNGHALQRRKTLKINAPPNQLEGP